MGRRPANSSKTAQQRARKARAAAIKASPKALRPKATKAPLSPLKNPPTKSTKRKSKAKAVEIVETAEVLDSDSGSEEGVDQEKLATAVLVGMSKGSAGVCLNESEPEEDGKESEDSEEEEDSDSTGEESETSRAIPSMLPHALLEKKYSIDPSDDMWFTRINAAHIEEKQKQERKAAKREAKEGKSPAVHTLVASHLVLL